MVITRSGVRDRGMGGLSDCDGPPVAWRFGTSLPTAQSFNILTWGGQAFAWLEPACRRPGPLCV